MPITGATFMGFGPMSKRMGIDKLTDNELRNIYDACQYYFDRAKGAGLVSAMRKIDYEMKRRRAREIIRKGWRDARDGKCDRTIDGEPMGSLMNMYYDDGRRAHAAGTKLGSLFDGR